MSEDDEVIISASIKRWIASDARIMRKQLTPAENRLWQALRCKRMCGVKFRRQHPIAPYIADFYTHALKLVIQVDEGAFTNRPDFDSGEREYLESRGLKVVHFRANQICTDFYSVIAEIRNIVEALIVIKVTKNPHPW